MRPIQSIPADDGALTRRGVLGYSVAAGIAWLLSRRGSSAFAAEEPPAEGGGKTVAADRLPGLGKAKRCILLFMDGGPSHLDTWDPKPGHPNQGETESIPTRIPGVRVAASLPEMAKRVGDLCIVRSMTSREGNHSRAKYLLHTGYAPNPTVTHPALGAVVSHEAGREGFDLPNFVQVNGNNGESGGFLGVAHNPFVVQDPSKPIANLASPPGVDDGRLDARLKFLGRLDRGFSEARGEEVPESRRVMYGSSRRLMSSPLTRAFDLSTEKDAVRERYGKDEFGQGCLMASRLAEAGVPVVEVRLNGWDTHQDNFTRVPELLGRVDRGMSNLVDDLKAKGLLESTLVVWMGEFGRTPTPNNRGGRDHYPRAWSLVLAGGGIVGGQVLGSTDAGGNEPAERPVTVPDLFASFAHAFGLDAGKVFYSGDRPITLVDKAGKPVRELFV